MSFGFGVGDFLAVFDKAQSIRKKWIDAPPEYAAIKNEVTNVGNILGDLQDLQDDLTIRESQTLADIASSCIPVLDSCDSLISKYAALTEPGGRGLPGKRVRRVWKRFDLDPEDIRHVREQLSSLVEQLTLELSVINSRLTSDVKADVVLSRERDDQHEREEIAQWYASAGFADQHNEYSKRRQTGSGSWFLQDDRYLRWRDDSCNLSNSTLLCPGIPGAGKTFMANAVINDTREHVGADGGCVVVYFYCNFNRREQQELEHIYSSLVRQLFQEHDAVPQQIKELYLKHRDRQTRPSSDELSTLLRILVLTYQRVFIVIDALDECNVDDGTRQRLLEDLSATQRDAGNIKILATTRFIPEILQAFAKCEQIEVRAAEEDINRYLDNRMIELAPFVRTKPQLQQEIRSQISNLVDGMFLLARLHFEALRGHTNATKLRQALHNLPRGKGALTRAYDTARERIDHQHLPQAELARHSLAWITYARRELSMRELQEALTITMTPGKAEIDPDDDLDEPSEILSVCAGLIIMDRETNIVRLIHYTTQDYIESIQDRWLPAVHVDLGRACLDYLSINAFIPGTIAWDLDLNDYYDNYALLSYMARHWGVHVRQAVSPAIHDLAIQFLCDDKKVCFVSQVMLRPNRDDWEPHWFGEGITALHLCAHFDMATLCKELIDRGHRSTKDSHERSPLQEAATFGAIETAEILLQAPGVDVNVVDDTGDTVLVRAAYNGYQEPVEMLIGRPETDVNVVGNGGLTALSWAASQGHPAIVQLLLRRPDIEINGTGTCHNTPLMWAAMKGHVEILEMLLRQPSIDVNACNEDGDTALMWAAAEGHKRIVETLLRQPNIDVTAASARGMTALIYAAHRGEPKVIQMLLRQPGVDVNAGDDTGWTPLVWAVAKKRREAVEILLREPDIDTHIDDVDSDSAWTWESEEEYRKTCGYVKSKFPDFSGHNDGNDEEES